jgi:hypothetical protein
MLTVITFWWGDKYPPEYVERLRAGFARHLREPHRFVCAVDGNLEEQAQRLASVGPPFSVTHIRDRQLLAIRGCFARLRLFDPEWQRELLVDDRIVCVDLDAVVTGPLDPLFFRSDPFLILQGANASNPCPYNGSLWMLRAGYRPDVWSDFSIAAAKRVPYYEFPDDQAWLNAKIPDGAGWNVGPESGIWSFAKRGWPKDNHLPDNAKLVVFPGWRDPSKFRYLPWIHEHWR